MQILVATRRSAVHQQQRVAAYAALLPSLPHRLYPVLLQKGWNLLKGYYHVIFQACLRHSYVPLAWKEGTGIFLPKHGKESYYEATVLFITQEPPCKNTRVLGSRFNLYYLL